MTIQHKDKKVVVYTQGFTSERWHCQTICVKKSKRKRTRKHCIEASILGFEVCLKKTKEGFITEINNNIGKG